MMRVRVPVLFLVSAFVVVAAARVGAQWSFGGYGEMHANFVEGAGKDQFDIHRIVFYTGYDFATWIRFNSELEVEHSFVDGGGGGEVAFEQAYLDFALSTPFNIRVGRLLTPLGIVNKRHEPTVFNGVERPAFDVYIIPSTWWSDGIGAFGSLSRTVTYEAYVVGGLNGAKFDAVNGIRGGRIEERPSLNEPAVVGRVDAYPFAGALVERGQTLRVGAASYWGGLNNGNAGNDPTVDGTLFIYSADFDYTLPLLHLRGAFAHELIGDAANLPAGTARQVLGWFGEVGARLLPKAWRRGKLARADAVVFLRYDDFDTQFTMPPGATADPAGDRSQWTTGISFFLTPSVVIKADYQTGSNTANATNLGIGWQF